MNNRFTALSSLLLAIATVHCGVAVGPLDAGADGNANLADAQTAADAVTADVPPAQTCAQVQASCTTAPAVFVRGHAAGLADVDGARVQIAIRYVLETGMGLEGPHGVVTARSVIQNGAFEACVCVPSGANNYPQIAAVVFAPGSTGELGRDVVRGMFSQRYATLGDEDFSMSLTQSARPSQAENALAAMDDRATTITVRGLDSTLEGGHVYAGLVADERPITALPTSATIAAGVVRIVSNMPGRLWPSERLVIMVDRNHNNVCDDGDLAASIRLDGRADLTGIGGDWLQGAAIQPVCQAIGLGEPRGG